MMSHKKFNKKIRLSIALKRKKIANVGFAKKLDTIVMSAQIPKLIRPEPEP